MCGALAVLALLGAGVQASAAPNTPDGVAQAVGDGLPLHFVQNRGQVDRRADYYLPGKDTSVFFTGNGLRFSLGGGGITDRRYSLGLDFVSARQGARPVGRGQAAGTISYFKGKPHAWKTGLPTYSKLAYENLWPGIDLVYSGSGNRLKYSFLVKPGADPAQIRLAWRGATDVRLGEGGQLEVASPAGLLRDEAPFSYQTVGGRRVKVDSSYTLAGERYGFRLGAFDNTRPLVIDPAVFVYAGFIGGSGPDQANNAALDAAGNLYVVGSTGSANFPTTVGSFDQSFAGGLTDAFVAKVNPSGTELLYATYIGGAGEEFGINIDVDAAGAAYVDGGTGSTEATFPATVGPDLTYNGGPLDAWVAKLTPSGTGLRYAGFVGGAAPSAGGPATPNEQANGLVVDSSGSAYVSGFTGSPQATFPDGTDSDGDGSAFDGIPGFDQTFNSVGPGVLDAFLVKVKADGSGLEYGTYVGGGAADAGTGLAVDGAGSAYMNIFTGSNERPRGMANPFGGFPNGNGFASVGRPGFDQSFNGPAGAAPADAAVIKLNTAASGAGSLSYGTYIGGAGVEQPFGNVLDSSGNLYLTGRTQSDQNTFPNGEGFASLAIPGFDQTFNGGAAPQDSFVAKLNASGSTLEYATYVGGSGDEASVAIDLDGAGSAYISGTTSSTEQSFPVQNGPDLSYNGGENDAYVAKLNPAGTRLDYAGYLGGGGDEAGIGMAVDGTGSAYAVGATQGRGFPVNVGPDTTFNGPSEDSDAFVAKIAEAAAVTPPPPPAPGLPPVLPNLVGKFTAKLSIARATINRRQRVLDVLAPITARASGRVRVELHAAGRRFRFTAPIDSANGRVRFRQRIPAAQARLGTGILTISYAGDADTRPQTVRLRAANRPADLRLARPRLVNGRVVAAGTVNPRARGVVRLQLEYERAGQTRVVRLRAPIRNGSWALNAQLSATELTGIAQRLGTLHSYTLFTGYFQERIRGEMRSFQVLGDG